MYVYNYKSHIFKSVIYFITIFRIFEESSPIYDLGI